MSDGSLILLDETGGFVSSTEICSAQELLLVADERERIFVAASCSTGTEIRELRLMEFDWQLGKRADVLLATNPYWISSLRIQAALGGHVLLSAHLNGAQSFLVDMNRGAWTEFDDHLWATTLTERFLFIREGRSLLRALAPDSGDERWVMDATDLPGACGGTPFSDVPCSGEWYGADVLATERGTLWVPGYFDRPAVLEVAPGGAVLRSCAIPDVEYLGGASLMNGRLVGYIGATRYAAWELPGRQSLAAGWYGSRGGPAGGQRAHAPPYARMR